MRQPRTETLVLSDGSMGYSAFWVQDRMGQGHSIGPYLNTSVGQLKDIDVFANKTTRQIIDLQLDALAVVFERQILAHVAFVAQAKDFIQSIGFDVEGAMQVI